MSGASPLSTQIHINMSIYAKRSKMVSTVNPQ